MRVHTATASLPTTTALGQNAPLPRHQLQRSARRNIWGRKHGKWWTGLSPSNTRVKLVARHLAQQIETGIRQTGSTTANSPCNLPLQTQQSCPPPSNRATYCSSGVVIPPPSLFNTQSVRVPTMPAHRFFLRKKIPASHRAQGGTPPLSLALGANHEGNKRVKVQASRIQSSRIGYALVCVCRNVQHRELNLPKSTWFALITAVMVAVPTGCLMSLPPLFSQNIQPHEKFPTSRRAQGVPPSTSLALSANREGKERAKGKASRIHSSRIGSALVCVRRNAQHRELKLPNLRHCAQHCFNGCCVLLRAHRRTSFSPLVPKYTTTRKKPHKS